ncbi:MAG TPA: EamA/RhaT family transporter, partial [Aequorivita sp.]|nr:EamA/RhaT family transporter [Aequorivita sp.]
LVQTLRSGILDSSGVFTINNVAIVMVSTVLGILLFKEKLLTKNWIGIGLAIIGIVLISFDKW